MSREKAAELAELAACRAESLALEQRCSRKLDEFGRDENAYKREQVQERQAQRHAAMAAVSLRSSVRGGHLMDEAALIEAASCGHSTVQDSTYYHRKVGAVSLSVSFSKIK